jgi:hypothetical protein
MGIPLVFTSYQQLCATLKQGRIYWIDGDWPYPDSDGRGHFFIVMNHEPRPESVLLLTHGSRGVDSARYHAALNGDDIDTLVVIEAGKYDIWKEETAIDCNDLTTGNLAKLCQIVDQQHLHVSSVELNPEDFDKILQGTLLSDRVTEVQKAVLRPK